MNGATLLLQLICEAFPVNPVHCLRIEDGKLVCVVFVYDKVFSYAIPEETNVWCLAEDIISNVDSHLSKPNQEEK